MFSEQVMIKKCIGRYNIRRICTCPCQNLHNSIFYLVLVETVAEEYEDGVTEQYSILFISAGVCVAVFIIFLGVLCFR